MTVVASNFARQVNDLYETEAWATRALIAHYPVRGLTVWEPAAGNHKIADVLKEFGAAVISSDITEYSRQHSFMWDFLGGKDYGTPEEVDAIITNPPFGKANRDAVKFAELALERCRGMVALLLTAKFDFGKTRKHLFQDNSRFAAKLALLDRIQWFPSAMTGTEDHAWYIWGPEGKVSQPARLLYGGRA